MKTKQEKAAIARANGKKSGRPPGKTNAENTKRALLARDALANLGEADAFVTLFQRAAEVNDFGVCLRILCYLYDQAHGKAPEQSAPAGGVPVRIVVGWQPGGSGHESQNC